MQTGLKPPKLPSGRRLRGPITQVPTVAALHERRRREDEREFDEMYTVYADHREVGSFRGPGVGHGCC